MRLTRTIITNRIRSNGLRAAVSNRVLISRLQTIRLRCIISTYRCNNRTDIEVLEAYNSIRFR